MGRLERRRGGAGRRCRLGRVSERLGAGLGGEGTLLEGWTLGFRRGGQGGRVSVSLGTDEHLLGGVLV